MYLKVAKMPSDVAAENVLSGVEGGVGEFVACATFRTFFVAPGLYFAGVRGKQLFWGSVAGSLGISLFSLAWTVIKSRNG